MPGAKIVHEGTLRQEQEKTYVHLPFEMPPGARRLDVEYTYSQRIGSNPLLTGGNTIDLGAFDARGIEFLNAGFRGWTGSERMSFFITESEATPGYLAGPLTPGTWHVLLGLYKVAPEGCAYRVTITVAVDASAGSAVVTKANAVDLPFSSPAAPFAPWLRGELHCHSWHSDGDRSAAGVVAVARERGLDFLAISDHNTIASQRELASLRDPGLVLLRGVEATTFKGHFCAWGIPDWVDFRILRAEDMQAALSFAAARGAVTSCNHPKPFGPPWEYDEVNNFDCVEVWNGPWSMLNQMALEYWLGLLAKGRRLTALAGSDWHRQAEVEQAPPRAPGTPCVWVYVRGAANQATILEAIRHGQVSLSESPEAPFLELLAGREFEVMAGNAVERPADGKLQLKVRCRNGAGYRLSLLDQNGVLAEHTLTGADETVVEEASVDASMYVRAQVRNEYDELKALTNPIYLE